jgi:hypothetical protein
MANVDEQLYGTLSGNWLIKRNLSLQREKGDSRYRIVWFVSAALAIKTQIKLRKKNERNFVLYQQSCYG